MVSWPTISLCPLSLSLSTYSSITPWQDSWVSFMSGVCSYNAMQRVMQRDPALESLGTTSVAITINAVSIYCGFMCLILLCYFLIHVISFSFCLTLCLYCFPFSSHLFFFINIPIPFFKIIFLPAQVSSLSRFLSYSCYSYKIYCRSQQIQSLCDVPLITIKHLRENTFSAQNIIFFLLARLFNFLSFSHFFLGSYHTY